MEIFEMALIVGTISVVSVVVALKLRKRKKEPKKEQVEKPPVTRFHRCSNQECGKLIPEDELHYEIVHITEPPSEYIMCPHCQTRLQILKKGELKIGPPITPPSEPAEKRVFNYDLTIDSKLVVVKKILKLLNEREIKPKLSLENGEMHVLFSSSEDLSFESLKQRGWVKSYEKKETSGESIGGEMTA